MGIILYFHWVHNYDHDKKVVLKTYSLKFNVNSLVLEGLAGYETGEGLVLLPLAERLPPVWVLAADHMQHVAFLETDACNETVYS